MITTSFIVQSETQLRELQLYLEQLPSVYFLCNPYRREDGTYTVNLSIGNIHDANKLSALQETWCIAAQKIKPKKKSIFKQFLSIFK